MLRLAVAESVSPAIFLDAASAVHVFGWAFPTVFTRAPDFNDVLDISVDIQ